MFTSLVICTYERPQSLSNLLLSVFMQDLKPDEILVVDGSKNSLSNEFFNIFNECFKQKIKYFHVDNNDRGLTKQRNFGIRKVSIKSEIIHFLDDDLILEPDYFQQIQKPFLLNHDVIGVGGIDMQSSRYFKVDNQKKLSNFKYYIFEEWAMKELLRYRIRKIFGLMPDIPPQFTPPFGHGRGHSFPPTGRTYEVDHFMGGIAAYRKNTFDKISFSEYFEGYGLYEDYDFCIRANKIGKLVVNTAAKVHHFHDPLGRPDYIKYGKMVVRNGLYILLQKNPDTNFSNMVKWTLITIIHAILRLFDCIKGPKRKEAFDDFYGRFLGLLSLIYNPLKIRQ